MYIHKNIYILCIIKYKHTSAKEKKNENNPQHKQHNLPQGEILKERRAINIKKKHKQNQHNLLLLLQLEITLNACDFYQFGCYLTFEHNAILMLHFFFSLQLLIKPCTFNSLFCVYFNCIDLNAFRFFFKWNYLIQVSRQQN